MLAETGVAATPGRDFDPYHGDDWVRFSFAGSSDDIAEAARRLADWLPKQG
jgi:aspartate/methionine/tyrosine aminotransferase